ncbi:hypothetical protein [Halanaerobaculum tunisiense]
MFNSKTIAKVPTAKTRISVNSENIFIASDYKLEPLVLGLSFPTSLTFDHQGYIYISETGYSYGPTMSNRQGRILKLVSKNKIKEIAHGFRAPLT